jgi:GT2 family glycosyltransferase
VKRPLPETSDTPLLLPNFRLAVVVLNYRTPEQAVEAARSAALDVDPAQDLIVIVDNASSDGSADTIEERLKDLDLPHIRLMRSPKNGGFAAGNNFAVRSIGARAYVLLNSDTVVRPGSMEKLFAVLSEDESIGLVSPLL